MTNDSVLLIAEPVLRLRSEMSEMSEMSDCPTELVCLVCKEVMRLAVMMPCCAGASCQDCAKNNINIYGSCPLCLAHSHTEDLIPYRMLREKVSQYFQSKEVKKKEVSPVPVSEEPSSPDCSGPGDCPSGSSSSPILQPTTSSEPSETGPAAIPVLIQEPGGIWLSPQDDTLGMFVAAMREIDAKKKSGPRLCDLNSGKERTQHGEQSRIEKEKDLEDVSSDDFDFEDGEGNLPERISSSGCRVEEAANNEAEMKPKMMDEKGKVKSALMKALMNMDEYDEERVRRMRKVLESSQSIKKSKRKKEKKKKRKDEVKIKEKTLRKMLKNELIKKEVLEEILKKKKKKRKHKKRSSDSSSSEEEVPLSRSKSPSQETFPPNPSLNDIQVGGDTNQSANSDICLSFLCLDHSDPSR